MSEPGQSDQSSEETAETGPDRTRVRRRTTRGTDQAVAMPDGDGIEMKTAGKARSRPLAGNPFAVTPSEDAEAGETDAARADTGAEDGGSAGDDDADDDTSGGRRRRRRRRGRGRGGAERGEETSSDDEAQPDEQDGQQDDQQPEDSAEPQPEADTARGDAADGRRGRSRKAASSNGGRSSRGGKDAGAAKGPGRDDSAKGKRAKSRSDEDDTAEDASDSDLDDDDDDDERGDGADSSAASGEDQASKSRSGRRRRRGRRGRGRRGKAGSAKTDSRDEQGSPTRLSARSQRSGGRRRVASVSPETRRVMAESPPKRMLVTVGTERTQIAVLEERTLVEHYVTQASEQSYVGNIYKGRVQNVLPGMEAAFVDIGKGRNGVLYAGEVNYDEADRDGNLPRIEQALKPGQAVLVQVTKDPMGTKGARLTQHLSLAGRYCVLAPGDDMLGISRKLPDDERDRLRRILKDLKPEGFGLIVRTAAESASAEQLEADVARLLERWKTVEEKAEQVKPLEVVYAEPQLVLRVIRDVFGPEHTQLIIDDPELADQVREYLHEVSPEHVDKVVTYQPPPGQDGRVERLFDAYEVTTQIRRALEKKVWLKSGGYLIIEKTEAMWVIDVNTGKFVGKDNLEETVLRNNIEAAEEIARQLRLRDMGGIIVIDFVDMIVPANREEVLKRFRRELARDKTKSRVMEISKLGLVQMTRKNVSKGLMEAFTVETDDVIPGRKIVEDLLA